MDQRVMIKAQGLVQNWGCRRESGSFGLFFDLGVRCGVDREVGGDRSQGRVIAFQKAARSCRRKASSHPARLNLPRSDPFDPSF